MNLRDYKTSIIGLLIIGMAITGAYLESLDKVATGLLITTGVGFLASADTKKE